MAMAVFRLAIKETGAAVLKSFEKDMDKITQKSGTLEQGLNRAGNGFKRFMGNVGTATVFSAVYNGFNKITEAIGASATALLDYDKKLREIKGVAFYQNTAESNKQFAFLEQQMRDIALATEFSADKVAELGLTYARMGYTASTGLNSILKSTADLLTITGESEDIVTQTLGMAIKGYKIDQMDLPQAEMEKQIKHFANVIHTATAESAMDFESFAYSAKHSLPIAKQAGLEFEEYASLLANLSNVGILGSLGGTGVKNILQAYMKPTDTMLAKMEEVKKKFGHAKDYKYPDFISFFQETVEGSSIEELFKMFNLRALASAAHLKDLKEGIQDFTKGLKGELVNVGETAKQIRDSIKTSMERTGSLVKNTLVEIYTAYNKESKITTDDNPFKKLNDSLVEFAMWVRTNPDFMKEVYKGFDSFIRMLNKVGHHIKQSLKQIPEIFDWFKRNQDTLATIGKVALSVFALGKAIGVLTVGLVALKGIIVPLGIVLAANPLGAFAVASATALVGLNVILDNHISKIDKAMVMWSRLDKDGVDRLNAKLQNVQESLKGSVGVYDKQHEIPQHNLDKLEELQKRYKEINKLTADITKVGSILEESWQIEKDIKRIQAVYKDASFISLGQAKKALSLEFEGVELTPIEGQLKGVFERAAKEGRKVTVSEFNKFLKSLEKVPVNYKKPEDKLPETDTGFDGYSAPNPPDGGKGKKGKRETFTKAQDLQYSAVYLSALTEQWAKASDYADVFGARFDKVVHHYKKGSELLEKEASTLQDWNEKNFKQLTTFSNKYATEVSKSFYEMLPEDTASSFYSTIEGMNYALEEIWKKYSENAEKYGQVVDETLRASLDGFIKNVPVEEAEKMMSRLNAQLEKNLKPTERFFGLWLQGASTKKTVAEYDKVIATLKALEQTYGNTKEGRAKFQEEMDALTDGKQSALNEKFQASQTMFLDSTQTYLSAIDSIYDISLARMKERHELQMEQLEEQADRASGLAGDNAMRKELIDQEYDSRKRKLEEEQALREKKLNAQRKKWAIASATIDMYKGAVQVLSDATVPFWLKAFAIGGVLATGAVQIAQMQAQNFALGGGVVDPLNRGNSDKIPVNLSGGEYVVPRDQVNRLGGFSGVQNQINRAVSGISRGGGTTVYQIDTVIGTKKFVRDLMEEIHTENKRGVR